MIGADGVYQAVAQGLAQGLFVAMRLNGRIAFDGKALGLVIMVIEP